MKARLARVGNNLYDLGTSNTTFLQVAEDLKTLGIKNWFFMLQLYDPTLVTVDPFAVDPKTKHTSLTQDQIARIVNECVRNPWYYLREISRIPDQGGTAVPYKANRGNIAQAYCILRGLDSWLELVRQKGKTQSALAIQAWAYNFGTTNSEFIFVNKDGDNAKTNLRRLTDQINLLPEYLQFKSVVDEEGVRTKARNNATMIRHPINNNSIITKPKATSYDKALSLARGLTAPILHFDEPEFTEHIGTIVANSVSTYEQAASNAKKNNAMYARIFTCTPGDQDTKSAQEAQKILDRTCPWTERIYDWTDEQIENYIASQGKECNRIFYIKYYYYQIGLTQEWLQEISAKIGDTLTVRREILLQRLHGSSLSPFDQEDIEYIVETEHKPIDELWLLDYFKFDVYQPLNKYTAYIIGVDCSTGTNGDNNAITILDPYTVEPVAEFECSFIGETKFCKLLIELIGKHLPKSVLCIERNSVGDAIIDFLLNSSIRSNLYFDKAKDLQEEKMKQNETIESILKKQAQVKTYYGVYTSGNSRETMMSILARHVNEYKEKFITHNIIRDLSRLKRTGSGKVQAIGDDHDDSIMSYLIALYVLYHGNNLISFGIIRGLRNEEVIEKKHKTADEIDPSLVSQELIDSVKKQEALERQRTYDDIMREAITNSQKKSYSMYQSGMISNNIFGNTPETKIINDIDNNGNIDLNFFNELNGF